MLVNINIQIRFKYRVIKYENSNFRLNNIFKVIKSILVKSNINNDIKLDDLLKV